MSKWWWCVNVSIFSRRVSLSVTCVEQVFVEVRSGLNLMIVDSVYITPGSNLLYEIHGRTAMVVCLFYPQGTDLILAGNSHLPNTSWYNDDVDNLIHSCSLNFSMHKQMLLLYSGTFF